MVFGESDSLSFLDASSAEEATCMQEEIHKQHTGLVHNIEEKKTIEKFGTKWVDHAKHKNACKVCARPFASPREKEAFVKRFASVGYATELLNKANAALELDCVPESYRDSTIVGRR